MGHVYTRCADVLLRAINTEQTDAYLCFFKFARQRACIRSYYFDKIKCLHRCLVCGHISNGCLIGSRRTPPEPTPHGCRQVYGSHRRSFVFFLRFSFSCLACLRRLCAPIIETNTEYGSCVAFVCTHDATWRCDRMSTSVAIHSTRSLRRWARLETVSGSDAFALGFRSCAILSAFF